MNFKNLLKLKNCIELLGEEKIGFTLINGVLITRSSFQFVSIFSNNFSFNFNFY
jgi:hypothetical protein